MICGIRRRGDLVYLFPRLLPQCGYTVLHPRYRVLLISLDGALVSLLEG